MPSESTRRSGPNSARPVPSREAAAPSQATAGTRNPAGPGSQVVYGIHAVTELLGKRRDQVHALFVHRETNHGEEAKELGGALGALCQTALRVGIRMIDKTRGELDRLARGGVHQGIVALCGEFQYARGTADILAYAQSLSAAPLIVIVDGVTDPQTLGALIRCTYVLGGHGVIIPQDRAVGITPAAIKAAAGATETLPIAQVKNLVRAMEELKEAGVWLVAAVAPGQQGGTPWQCDLAQPTGLVAWSWNLRSEQMLQLGLEPLPEWQRAQMPQHQQQHRPRWNPAVR